jgi:hypothetical protein
VACGSLYRLVGDDHRVEMLGAVFLKAFSSAPVAEVCSGVLLLN